MKIIYVAGKYRGKSENDVFENIVRARRKAVELWSQGWVVLCPHANSMFMSNGENDKVFLEGSMELLRRSDAIYMMKDWRFSEGSKEEFAEACRLNMKIYYEE